MNDKLQPIAHLGPRSRRAMISRAALATASAGMLIGAAPVPAPNLIEAKQVATKTATVTVRFQQSRGVMPRVERWSNLTRAWYFAEQRDGDVEMMNAQGLHGEVYRVWVDTDRIHDAATGCNDYSSVADYLEDASRLSDTLLVVLDTRVQIRDGKMTPAQVKPIIKPILRDIKTRHPKIKYIEAFNEPDHNLAKVMKPEDLYSYYIPYYEAVNELNAELKPAIPIQLGGPAFMQFNETWMRAFLDRYKADTGKGKRLDFFSWHAYGTFPEGTGALDGPRAFHFYKGDPSEVATQRVKLDQELRSRGLDTRIPGFITETGMYPGPSFDNATDPWPDYLIQAAGVPSLFYWFLEQPRIHPFNWVLRHSDEPRKNQLVAPPAERAFTPYGNTMLMMAKLKSGRVAATSDALAAGKGIYAIATADKTGAAIMIWNYQHKEAQDYTVTLDLGRLPPAWRGRTLRQRVYRIDARTSNYWADPATANLQQVADTRVPPSGPLAVELSFGANALQLVLLEPMKP